MRVAKEDTGDPQRSKVKGATMDTSHAYEERVIPDAGDLPADDAPGHLVGHGAHLAAGHQGNRIDTRY